jgi:NADP-dependent 3-hydroxy acid dehydrogenase YdfG
MIRTGIGLMIAQALEANGAIVYIVGRRKESLDKAAATAVRVVLLSAPNEFILHA